MAKVLMPRLVAHCQHEGAALFIEFKGMKGYCHYCHDIFNLIKKSIEINNKFKKWWQSWQSLAKSKSRLMGITLIKFHVVGRPPN
jgi:lipase chaperone LimK